MFSTLDTRRPLYFFGNACKTEKASVSSMSQSPFPSSSLSMVLQAALFLCFLGQPVILSHFNDGFLKSRASQVAWWQRICQPMQETQETQVQSLDWEDALEEETATHLPGKSHGQRSLLGYSPWSRRVGHDWAYAQAPWVHLEQQAALQTLKALVSSLAQARCLV